MKVLVSDLDGTLIHVPVNWGKVKEALSKALNSEVSSIFEALRGARARDEGLFRELSRLVEEYEVNSIKDLEELRGSRELLRCLKDHGVKVAIVTLQSERSLKKALEVSGLAPYIDVYVTRDEELDRARQIKIVLQKLGAEIGRDAVVFMGDRPSDFDAGRRLGIPTIIIGSTAPDPLGAISAIADVLGLSLEKGLINEGPLL
jgi:HAD superfamily hydrolase (TIGR01549 family)